MHASSIGTSRGKYFMNEHHSRRMCSDLVALSHVIQLQKLAEKFVNFNLDISQDVYRFTNYEYR